MSCRKLSKLENFQRMMNQREPNWIPLDIPMTPPMLRTLKQKTGFEWPSEAFDLDFYNLGTGPKPRPNHEQQWRQAYKELGFDLPMDKPLEFWPDHGCVWAVPPAQTMGEASHLREMLHPLSTVTSVDQLKDLPWTDYESADLAGDLGVRMADCRRQGMVSVANMECTVFEMAWYARGMENLFFDLIEGNGIADWLLDWHTRRSQKLAETFVRAGVDVIGLGDDVSTQTGMMMAPDFWRQHLKPRLAKVIQTIREHQGDRHVYIRYHSDGDIREIIPELIELGIDLLNPVQPECMPGAEVIRQYQKGIGFWGMIGTQSVMPFGTCDQVRSVVNEIARYAREGARVIAAPTHVLEPDVPWENVLALVDQVRKIDLQRQMIAG